jgi:hypothetical protein
MATMPVTAMPMMPPTMPMPVPMVVAPTHLFGLEMIDLVLPDDRGLRGFRARRRQTLTRRNRRQRRSVRTCSKRGGARGRSKGEFEKVAALHRYPPLRMANRGEDFCWVEMNGR